MREKIQSPQNQNIKLAASLKQKKYREETGLFLVEGVRLVEEVLASDWFCESIFVADSFGGQERSAALLKQAEECSHVYEVSEALLAKISDTREPQGIVAIVKQKEQALPKAGANPFWVLADGIQDPGNLGTLIRTADAAGCDGVLLIQSVDVYNPKVVRASMGSLFHLPVLSAEADLILQWLQAEQISLYGTSVENAVSYYNVDWRPSCCIAFGNEGQGMSSFVKKYCDGFVHIPLIGKAESLNVSISAAVILYEALRQRRFSS
ncbi:MAG: RNA methyltransferase [Sporomusaceae bacterium]|nr:RNA methyltransferase [Sporomusaceae bacterium]